MIGSLDPEERDALVTKNLDLADFLAGKFDGRGIDLDDLTQEARLGLCEAAKRFDPSAYADNFKIFAASVIRGKLKDLFKREERFPRALGYDPDDLVSLLIEPDLDAVDPVALQSGIDALPPADRQILTHRFGIDGQERWTIKEMERRLQTSSYLIGRSITRSLHALGVRLRQTA